MGREVEVLRRLLREFPYNRVEDARRKRLEFLLKRWFTLLKIGSEQEEERGRTEERPEDEGSVLLTGCQIVSLKCM